MALEDEDKVNSLVIDAIQAIEYFHINDGIVAQLKTFINRRVKNKYLLIEIMDRFIDSIGLPFKRMITSYELMTMI